MLIKNNDNNKITTWFKDDLFKCLLWLRIINKFFHDRSPFRIAFYHINLKLEIRNLVSANTRHVFYYDYNFLYESS